MVREPQSENHRFISNFRANPRTLNNAYAFIAFIPLIVSIILNCSGNRSWFVAGSDVSRENSFVCCYEGREQFSIMRASRAKSCAHRPPHCLIIGFGKLSVYHWFVELHINWLPAHKNSIKNAALRKWHPLPCEILKPYYNGYLLLHRDDVELDHCCTESSKSGSWWNEFASHFTVASPRRCWFHNIVRDCQKNRGLKCGFFSLFLSLGSFSVSGY